MVAAVVFRCDLLLDGVVDHLGVEFVLIALVGEGALHGQGPSGTLLVALDPPAVEHGELHHAVHHALLARRARSLQRTGRGVHPDVDALNHLAGQVHVVVLQEEYLAHELRHGRYLHNALDEILTGLVVRVSLAGEDELHGALFVVHDLRQTVEVREEQVGALVGGEAAGEADGEDVGLDAVDDLNHLAGRIQTHLVGIAVALADVVDQLVFEHHALMPELLVRNLVDLLPGRDVVDMALEALGEVAGVETAQVRRDPGGEMYAVGYVADVQLVLEVAGPHVAQNLLRHLAVEPRYAVDLLREVAGQHRHRELLVRIVGVGLAQVDELLPGDAQHVGIVRHVLTDHRLREGVVTGRYGVWVVKSDEERITSSASEKVSFLRPTRLRMRSMPMKAAWPSLQW